MLKILMFDPIGVVFIWFGLIFINISSRWDERFEMFKLYMCKLISFVNKSDRNSRRSQRQAIRASAGSAQLAASNPSLGWVGAASGKGGCRLMALELKSPLRCGGGFFGVDH